MRDFFSSFLIVSVAVLPAFPLVSISSPLEHVRSGFVLEVLVPG